MSDSVIPVLSAYSELSDTCKKGGDEAWKSLIPQCNWRFEHCYLRLQPPNHCQHPSECSNSTHVRCAALWSLKNGMTIDDPKSVRLWCIKHGYSKTIPPEETGIGTECKWKWVPNKNKTLWSEADIEELNSNRLWFAPMCTDCFLVNKYIGIGENLYSHPWKEHWLNTTGKYILFPLNWFHQGYFNRRGWRSAYLQAQLFAVT